MTIETEKTSVSHPIYKTICDVHASPKTSAFLSLTIYAIKEVALQYAVYDVRASSKNCALLTLTRSTSTILCVTVTLSMTSMRHLTLVAFLTLTSYSTNVSPNKYVPLTHLSYSTNKDAVLQYSVYDVYVSPKSCDL